jgi:predicted phage terminase large subunit-like protein
MIKNPVNIGSLTKAQKEHLRNQLQAEFYRRSFYEFFRDASKVLYPQVIWDHNWHFKYLCDLLQYEVERIIDNRPKTKDYIINLPFRSGKSILISQIFPVWCWIKSPELIVMQISHSELLSVKQSHYSKMLIESEWFAKLFPSIQLRTDTQAKNNYMTNSGGKRISFGIGSSIIGEGCNIQILDDINNPDDSQETLKSCVNTFKDTLYSRLNNPTIDLRIILQQRISESDICGYLLDQHPDKYYHICLPVQLSDNISPSELISYYIDNENLFWKSRFDLNVIDDYRQILGARAFAGQLMQKPQLESDQIIKKSWLNVIPIDDNYLKTIHLHSKLKFYFIDTAYGEKDSDYNAVLECFKYNNCLYITNVYQNKMEFPDFIRFLKEIIDKNRLNKIYIEGKASGKSVKQQLKASTNFNIIELNPNKDKITRLKAIAPTVEGQRIFIINGFWNKEFIDQVTTNYPSNDDMRDCLTYAVETLLINSFNKGTYHLK